MIVEHKFASEEHPDTVRFMLERALRAIVENARDEGRTDMRDSVDEQLIEEARYLLERLPLLVAPPSASGATVEARAVAAGPSSGTQPGLAGSSESAPPPSRGCPSDACAPVPLRPTCAWYDDSYDDFLDPASMPEGCSEVATHRSCVPHIDAPTCAKHKCRCAKPLELPRTNEPRPELDFKRACKIVDAARARQNAGGEALDVAHRVFDEIRAEYQTNEECPVWCSIDQKCARCRGEEQRPPEARPVGDVKVAAIELVEGWEERGFAFMGPAGRDAMIDAVAARLWGLRPATAADLRTDQAQIADPGWGSTPELAWTNRYMANHKYASTSFEAVIRETALTAFRAGRGIESLEHPRCPTPERLKGIIAFARETWRDDGAEGEAVHRLCDALESRPETAKTLEHPCFDDHDHAVELLALRKLAEAVRHARSTGDLCRVNTDRIAILDALSVLDEKGEDTK